MASASDSRRRCTLVLLALLSLSPLCLAHGQEVPQPAPGQPAAPPAPRPQIQQLPFAVPFPAPTPSPGPAQAPPPSPAPPSEAPPGPTGFPPPAVFGFPSLTLPGLPPAAFPGGGAFGPPSLEAPAPIRSFRFAPILGREAGPLQVAATLTIEEEFNDNVNQTQTNRQSQLSTIIAPGIAAHIDRWGTTLDLAFALNCSIPNNNAGPENNTGSCNLNNNLSLNAGRDLTPRLHLGISENYTRSNDFQDIGNITAPRTGQNVFWTNSASANLSYSFSPWQAGLSYTYNYSQNDTLADDSSQSQGVSATLGYSIPGYNVTANYGATRGDGDINTSYWSQSVGVSASHPFTPNITGTMSGFFNYQTPDVGPRIDPLLERVGRQFVIYGANAGVNITLSPVSFLSVSLGAQVFAPRFGSNSITPSTAITYTRQFSYFSFSANYVNGFQSNFTAIDNTGVSQTRAASVSLATSVLRNLTAGLTGIYAENEFKQTTLVGGRAGQVERTWAANANLNYAILQWLSLYLGYTFNIRTSDSPGGEWYQNTIRFGLTGTFPLL